MVKGVQKRRMDICVTKKVRPDVTNEQLAREFNCSLSTINAALKWGVEAGIYELDNTAQLENRIVEVSNEIERLEKMAALIYKNAMRYMKDTQKKRSLLGDFVPLVKEIREQRVLLMELQGLYRQNINVQVNNVQNNVLVLPQKSEPESWLKLVEEAKKIGVASTT